MKETEEKKAVADASKMQNSSDFDKNIGSVRNIFEDFTGKVSDEDKLVEKVHIEAKKEVHDNVWKENEIKVVKEET